MTERVTVRRVGPADWRVWRDLRLRSLTESPDSFGSTAASERRFTEEQWRERVAGQAVLALVDGVPVAMGAGFRVRPGWVRVVAMWTDPAFRGRGLGTRVLHRIVRVARAEDRRVELHVARHNSDARRVYERYGFVATGRTEPLRGDCDLLVDEMVLPVDVSRG